jgi:hypothetical protein
MIKVNQTPADRVELPQRHDRWKAIWRKVKIPLQIVFGQIIGLAVRHWLG